MRSKIIKTKTIIITRIKNNNGETAAVKGLNRNQMIECAKSLLNEQKGSKQYEDMLKMFGTLGLNANNMKTVIDSTPKENNNNSNINHSNEKKSEDGRHRF